MTFDALQNNDANLPDSYRQIMLAIAMGHDVGHGPFSHALEKVLDKSVPDHAKISADLIRGNNSFLKYFKKNLGFQGRRNFISGILTKYNKLKDIPKILADYGVDRNLVADVLDPKGEVSPRNLFLKELMDNSLIDIDKMDYLPRDSRQANVPEGYIDPSRILNGLRIIEDGDARHIAVADNTLDDVKRFVAARKYMYRNVYTHKTILKYEAMFCEAVKRVTGYFKEKGIEIHFLTDDELLNFLMRSDDRVAVELAYDVKYGRPFLYDEAFSIRSRRVEPRDRRSDYPKICRLNAYLDSRKGGLAEDAVRDDIVNIANRNSAEKIHDHEVLVRV